MSPAAVAARLAGALRPGLLVYLYATAWVVVGVLTAIALGQRPVVVDSGSMAPTLDRGDLVLVVPAGRIDPGDIVTFARPGAGLITHRVVGLDPSGALRTKGDANRVADSIPVPRQDVVGVTRLAVPLVGRPALWLGEGRWAPLVVWGAITSAALAVVVRRPPLAGRDASLASGASSTGATPRERVSMIAESRHRHLAVGLHGGDGGTARARPDLFGGTP